MKKKHLSNPQKLTEETLFSENVTPYLLGEIPYVGLLSKNCIIESCPPPPAISQIGSPKASQDSEAQSREPLVQGLFFPSGVYFELKNVDSLHLTINLFKEVTYETDISFLGQVIIDINEFSILGNYTKTREINSIVPGLYNLSAFFKVTGNNRINIIINLSPARTDFWLNYALIFEPGDISLENPFNLKGDITNTPFKNGKVDLSKGVSSLELYFDSPVFGDYILFKSGNLILSENKDNYYLNLVRNSEIISKLIIPSRKPLKGKYNCVIGVSLDGTKSAIFLGTQVSRLLPGGGILIYESSKFIKQINVFTSRKFYIKDAEFRFDLSKLKTQAKVINVKGIYSRKAYRYEGYKLVQEDIPFNPLSLVIINDSNVNLPISSDGYLISLWSKKIANQLNIILEFSI